MSDKNQAAPANYVFISYNHKDVKWAKWLQKKLEWYRLPTEAHNEFSDSRYIRPVFRDRDNLTSGVLNDSLRKNLEASRYLVVICSPNSAQSEWVSDEIRAFIEMGRLEQIVPFIVEGSPEESFPLALRQWNQANPDRNLLGIAVTDDGRTDRQKAFVRLVAHLLGLQFDTLWQRHKRFILPVRRDSTFAVFAGRVFDGDVEDYSSAPMAGVLVTVGEKTAETDVDGCFRLVFPLAEQTETKPISLARKGFLTLAREDESPSAELVFLMHR